MSPDQTTGNITTTRHPEYDSTLLLKYRDVFTGGLYFVQNYLEKYSLKEDPADFTTRMRLTPPSSHAKGALIDIKNAIYNRIGDVTRNGGPTTYQDAVRGSGTGVDGKGKSMKSFMGATVLPELLAMGRVGVYVDKPSTITNVVDGTTRPVTKADTAGLIPYVYMYTAENILSWTYDNTQRLRALLLRDTVYEYESGLVSGTAEQYRFYQLADDSQSVTVTFYDAAGAAIGTPQTLALTDIPFVMGSIGQSLLTDIADDQIAIMNLNSTDVDYARRANFSMYTEQYNMESELKSNLQRVPGAQDSTGNAIAPDTKTVAVGLARGRKYPKGLERPGFINPSSEPLKASIDKQNELKNEIRQLLNLALTNLAPTRESASSKNADRGGKEEGLAFVALELEYMEQQVAKIWALYEGSDPAQITYPENYSLKTDTERFDEADKLYTAMTRLPSLTLQKKIAKQIVNVLIGNRLTSIELSAIYSEIDAVPVLVTDPKVIQLDLLSGLLSTELASQLRGYPIGESIKASKEQAARLAIIAISQTKAAGAGAAASVTPNGVSGVGDLNPAPAGGAADNSGRPAIQGGG